MDNVQELREKTNPVFNTAKATLLHLTQAGHADAAVMAERLGLDLAAVTGSDEGKTGDHPKKCVNFHRGCRIEAPPRRYYIWEDETAAQRNKSAGQRSGSCCS